MLNITPILVQVEGSGIDWPAIVASISTGVAAVAGIGGTLWQASRNWSHEAKLAKIAEKRRIYANCLATFNAGLKAAAAKEAHNQVPDAPGRADDLRDYNAALVACLTAFFELVLVAPHEVEELAREVISELSTYPAAKGTDDLIGALTELTKAMRVDLGESPLSTFQASP